MGLNKIIKNIFYELSDEIKKDENKLYLRNEILNPIIKEVIDELYPYFLKLIIVIVLIPLFLIITIILNIKVIFKN